LTQLHLQKMVRHRVRDCNGKVAGRIHSVRAEIRGDECVILEWQLGPVAMLSRLGISAARLVGCEILGLSRQALALLESADARAALTSSTQALRLLDRTGATEGPEEELWFTHHRVLRALGDPSAASAVDHAHAVYRNKLARLRSSEWRQAFDATELHQQIRAAMS